MNTPMIDIMKQWHNPDTKPALYRWALLSLLFLSLSVVTACGKKNVKPQPTVIAAEIVVSSGVNPDQNGRPSPIVLRIYELKALGKFKAADFYGLLNDDAALLGKDLVHREEMHVKPGAKQPYHRTVTTDTEHIGVIAAYRNINDAVWKAMAPVPANQTSVFSISVNDLTLSIKAK